MRASIVLLRRRGLRLVDGEHEPAVEGELTIGFAPNRKAGQPPLREASLTILQGASQTRVTALLPLFDARVVSLVDNVLTVTGIELNADSSSGVTRVSEHVQVWRCTLMCRH